jgi:hypothetical protein
MNAHLLCASVVASTLAALTFNPFPKTASRPPPAALTPSNSAASLQTEPRGEWETVMLGVSDNAETFRVNAARDIEGCALATQAMSRRCDKSRTYLQTRLQALREHVDYARAELLQLPSRQGELDFTKTHAHFYRTMNGLTEAFTQALNELDDGA